MVVLERQISVNLEACQTTFLDELSPCHNHFLAKQAIFNQKRRFSSSNACFCWSFMLVFPGVFGRGRFSELWGFLMICWVSSRRFLGMCPAVLSFWSSLHPSLFWMRFWSSFPTTKHEKASYANKPTNKWEIDHCQKSTGRIFAAGRCAAGQRAPGAVVFGVRSERHQEWWRLQTSKYEWKNSWNIYTYVYIKKNKYLFLNFCQTSMHVFWDYTGFEGISHPFRIHLRRTKNHPLPTERPCIIQVLIGPVAVGNLWKLQKILRRIFHIPPDLSVMFR